MADISAGIRLRNTQSDHTCLALPHPHNDTQGTKSRLCDGSYVMSGLACRPLCPPHSNMFPAQTQLWEKAQVWVGTGWATLCYGIRGHPRKSLGTCEGSRYHIDHRESCRFQLTLSYLQRTDKDLLQEISGQAQEREAGAVRNASQYKLEKGT